MTVSMRSGFVVTPAPARHIGCRHSPRQQRPRAGAGSTTGDMEVPHRAQTPEGAQKQQQQQQQQQQHIDIVSGNWVPQAQGPCCSWPRLEQRRRWEEAALMTTGFPVPAGYGCSGPPGTTGGGKLWRLRNPERQPPSSERQTGWVKQQAAAGAGQGMSLGSLSAGQEGPVMPVFRGSPYSAEAARQRRPSPTARILFLDDGCTCRAPLAAAVLQKMLSKLGRPLDVEVAAASIGTPVPGPVDERVARVAQEMGIPLPVRRPAPREFDEMRDTVEYDLILVMDKYDRQEVVREVSVLERLNPGGAYLTRVRRLGDFARAGQLVFRDRCLLAPEDVPDPLYGVVSMAAEQAGVRAAVHCIALCCRGLLSYLLKLRARCGVGVAEVPLRVALAQSLQCPAIDTTSHHALSALIHCQRLPAQHGKLQQQGQGSKAGVEAACAGLAAAPQTAGGTQQPLAAAWAAHVSAWPRPVWIEDHGGKDGELGDGSDADELRPLWTVREVAGQTVVVRRPRRRQPHRSGYWSDICNVQAELRNWMRAHGLLARLPSQSELRASGANSLSASIDTHGGLAVFGRRMCLPLASGRVANGQWADFNALAEELQRFVKAKEQPAEAQAVVPIAVPAADSSWAQIRLNTAGQNAGQSAAQAAYRELAAAGHSWPVSPPSPLSGGASAGGSSDAEGPSKAAGQRTLRYASCSWSSGGGGREPGPATATLLRVDAVALDGVMGHGGDGSSSAGLASSGDTNHTSGSSCSSSSSTAVGIDSSSGSGVTFLPTQQELRCAGRTDLIGGIRMHGGSLAVARRLGWAVRHGRLPSEEVVVAELLHFAQLRQQGREHARQAAVRTAGGWPQHAWAPLVMPTLRELEAGGRADLAGAVQRLGGVQVFAHLLEEEQRRRRQRSSHQTQALGWGEQQERQQYSGECHAQARGGVEQQKRGQLAPRAVPARQVTQGAGVLPPQPAVVRVGQAVVQLIEARGWERRVPTKQELYAAGRRDLHAAIARCGGAQKVAEHLRLPYAEMRGRPRRHNSSHQQQGQEQQQQQGTGGAQPAPPLQEVLASRIRMPAGGVDWQATLPGAAPPALAGPARAQRVQGPASRLLERELVLEAYQDATFV